MHLDIQTFSDLTDIDTSHQLSIDLEIAVHGDIDYHFYINGNELAGTSVTYTHDLLTPIRLQCTVEHFEPGYSGVEIKKLCINGLEILPKYQHKAHPTTAYIDFLGDWSLVIDKPFYVWYHELTGQGWIA